MFSLRKVPATTLVVLAGVAGLLVAAGGPIAALGQGDAMHGEVSVLADSPWGFDGLNSGAALAR